MRLRRLLRLVVCAALALPATAAEISAPVSGLELPNIRADQIVMDGGELGIKLDLVSIPFEPSIDSAVDWNRGSPAHLRSVARGFGLRVSAVANWVGSSDRTYFDQWLGELAGTRPQQYASLPYMDGEDWSGQMPSQIARFRFGCGNLYRYVGQLSQEDGPLHRDAKLQYIAHGITDDGKFLAVSFHDVAYRDAPVLTPEQLQAMRTVAQVDEHNVDVLRRMNAAEPSRFEPDLRALDRMMQSLQISCPAMASSTQEATVVDPGQPPAQLAVDRVRIHSGLVRADPHGEMISVGDATSEAAHVAFRADGFDLRVFSYASVLQSSGDASLQMLHASLGRRVPMEIPEPTPAFMPGKTAFAFVSRPAIFRFACGKLFRFIGHRSMDPSLTYVAQGLTDDGRFVVAFEHSLRLPEMEKLDALQADRWSLDAPNSFANRGASAFHPDLNDLDRMLASLDVDCRLP